MSEVVPLLLLYVFVVWTGTILPYLSFLHFSQISRDSEMTNVGDANRFI